MKETGNIRRNVWVKSWTNYLVTLKNVADVGCLGLEREGWRGRGRGGNKRSRKHDHTCWWLMSFRLVRCHLHGWFVGFWSFQIKAPTFDIFRWNWRQNVPYENIEVKCLESGLTANHHKVFCTLSSATYDIQWQWKEKNVVVIIVKIKTTEIIRSIWIQNTNECKSCYLHRNVASIHILVKIQE